MNNIIITGSSGLVATQLIMLLLKKDGIHLHLLTGNVQKLCDRYSNYKDKISVYDLESFMFFCESHHDVSFQCLVHTAFARSSEGDLLAQSLKYCEKNPVYCKNNKFEGICKYFVTECLWTKNQAIMG